MYRGDEALKKKVYRVRVKERVNRKGAVHQSQKVSLGRAGGSMFGGGQQRHTLDPPMFIYFEFFPAESD